jgi:quercetin dioxygenase-like cupin family protein
MGDNLKKIFCINWNELPWKPVRQGVDCKRFSGEGATLQLARLKPGHAPRPHHHPYEQIVYILSGSVDFHVGEEIYALTEGGCLVIPPEIVHYAIVTGKDDVLNLDVFTPKRKDLV